MLARCLDTPRLAVVSLQKDARPDELAALGVANYVDAGPRLGDFADTAALIANLDLVLTVDTSVCHLAGALGAPTWILIDYDADWRWMVGRSDSPWYPTARLFRQPRRGEWPAAIETAHEALAALAASPREADIGR